MGSNISRTVSSPEIVTEAISEFVSSKSASCKGNQTVINEITTGDVVKDINISGIKQSSDQLLNVSCFISSLEKNEFKKEITSKIKSKIKDEFSGVSGSVYSKRLIDDYTKALTKTVDKINLEDVKECIINSVSGNIIRTGDSEGTINIKDIEQTITQKTILNCKFVSESVNSTLSKLDSDFDKSIESINSGIFGGNNIIFLAIGVIVILLIIMKIRKGRTIAPASIS